MERAHLDGEHGVAQPRRDFGRKQGERGSMEAQHAGAQGAPVGAMPRELKCSTPQHCRWLPWMSHEWRSQSTPLWRSGRSARSGALVVSGGREQARQVQVAAASGGTPAGAPCARVSLSVLVISVLQFVWLATVGSSMHALSGKRARQRQRRGI